MELCVLYYVDYSLYNVKKVGFFYLGWNFTLTKKINAKLTTEIQFFYFKDREHQLIWYDMTHNQTHPRSYAQIHCDQVWC